MRPALACLLLVLSSLFYSLLRYCVFGNVEWHQQLYLLNKALAMVAAFSLLFSAWYGWRKLRQASRFWGQVVLHCASLHIVLSLTLLPQGYYPRLLIDEGFSFIGGLSLLFGMSCGYICGLLVILSSRPSQVKTPNEQRKFTHKFNYTFLLLILLSSTLVLHLMTLGFNGWLTPKQWPGYLPPISLLCFIACLISWYLQLRSYFFNDYS